MTNAQKELEIKLKRMGELLKVIQSHKGVLLDMQMKQDIDNLEFRMEFRLKDLVDRTKLEEADIKIGIFEEMVKLLT